MTFMLIDIKQELNNLVLQLNTEGKSVCLKIVLTIN